MGIYTSNRYLNEGVVHDYASEIPANMAYGASLGCAQVLADCQANDMALFESAIYSDFAEVKALQEGVQVVNENAFTNVIKKIVEMFKKLLAKIKGIFAAFIAKLNGAFKDGKKLVKQYEKQIIKYSNWKEFKCKGVREPINPNIKSSIDTLFTQVKSVAVDYTLYSQNGNDTLKTGVTGFETAEKIKDGEASDIKIAIIKKYLNGVDNISEMDEVHTSIMDKLFKEEETIEGEDKNISSSYFTSGWIKGILEEDKWEKDVKKFNEKLEKNINTVIDNLNKAEDKIAEFIQKNDGKTATIKQGLGKNNLGGADADGKVKKTDIEFVERKSSSVSNEDIQKAVSALQKLASNEQEVITKVTSEYLSTVKFTMAQARKVWTAAAAWSSGVHKESVEFSQAVAECSSEQFYNIMEAVC